MTIKRRLVVSLADIRAVTLQCSKCSYSVSAAPQEGLVIPEECPQGHAWRGSGESVAGMVERRFMEGLRSAVRSPADPQSNRFTLLLEFDAPTP